MRSLLPWIALSCLRGAPSGEVPDPSDTAGGGATPNDLPLVAPELRLDLEPKTLAFSWTRVPGATEYRLLETVRPGAAQSWVVALPADTESYELQVPLFLRGDASYVLEACDDEECTQSEAIPVPYGLVEAIGYDKATPVGRGDGFGEAIATSRDGSTIAVSAPGDDSRTPGDATDDAGFNNGAVSVFVRDGLSWQRHAYLNPSAPEAQARFGTALAISGDGGTIVVGAYQDSTDAVGIDGKVTGSTNSQSGGAWIFVRRGDAWEQEAYLKASNADAGDQFGISVAISSDGSTIAVGANGESSITLNNAENDQADRAGAVYVFQRAPATSVWREIAYVKAPTIDDNDLFGSAVALDADGNVMVVGAPTESSDADRVDGPQDNDERTASGAAYVFEKAPNLLWEDVAFLKASNAGEFDTFGTSVAIDGSGSVVVVGAPGEGSTATGVNADGSDDGAPQSGAAYVFVDRAGWQEDAYLKPWAEVPGGDFGRRVAISGNGEIVAVADPDADDPQPGVVQPGSQRGDPQTGGVYVYRAGPSQWQAVSLVNAASPGGGDGFGRSLSLDRAGSLLLVGAPQDDRQETASGAFYTY